MNHGMHQGKVVFGDVVKVSGGGSGVDECLKLRVPFATDLCLVDVVPNDVADLHDFILNGSWKLVVEVYWDFQERLVLGSGLVDNLFSDFFVCLDCAVCGELGIFS